MTDKKTPPSRRNPSAETDASTSYPFYLVLQGEYLLWEDTEKNKMTIIVPDFAPQEASGHAPPLACGYGSLKAYPLTRGNYVSTAKLKGLEKGTDAIGMNLLTTDKSYSLFKKERTALKYFSAQPNLPAIQQRSYLSIEVPRPITIYGWNYVYYFDSLRKKKLYATATILQYKYEAPKDPVALPIFWLEGKDSVKWAPKLLQLAGQYYAASLSLIPVILQDDQHAHATAVIQRIENLLSVIPYSLDILFDESAHGWHNPSAEGQSLQGMLDLLAPQVIQAKNDYPIDDCRLPPLWLY